MEFLYEMDGPARSTSREIDLDAEPGVASALAEAGVRTDFPEAVEEEQARLEPQVPDLSLEIGLLLPSHERPQTADEQHEQRVRRAIVRIQTCRDAFRLMGHLGLPDAERKAAARMFMELDAGLGRAEHGQSAIKDPDGVLAAATKEQLDTAERLIGPIEDRLLLLDQHVPRAAFETACSGRKVTRKTLVRYGRLLASRRFQADERRSRFEWIATQLLAPLDAAGRRRTLPVEHVRRALQHLIGGLPHKIKEQELVEALTHLRDAIARVQQFTSAGEFFESGFYVDVYGYKVTMRDQLLVPEFLYFSVVLNAAVHNRLEGWIADLERLHSANQLRHEGSPREQIMGRLLAEEEAIENALGVRRRPAPQLARIESLRPESKAPAKAKPKAKQKKQRSLSFEIIWDRQMIALLASLAVVLAVTGYLLVYTGVVGKPSIEAMTSKQMRAMSPLLARAWLVGDGDGRHLRATVMPHRWDRTEARERREQADRIVATLAARGIKNAEIKRGEQIVIRVVDGFIVEVAGGKL